MKSKIMQRSFMCSILVLFLLAACKKDNNNNNNNNGGTPSGNKDSTAVSISGFKFSPATLTVANGTTVTWTNNDSAPHTVTADDNSFTSPTLNQGDTYKHTFSNTGTINYHCNIHPSMTASVTVQ